MRNLGVFSFPFHKRFPYFCHFSVVLKERFYHGYVKIIYFIMAVTVTKPFDALILKSMVKWFVVKLYYSNLAVDCCMFCSCFLSGLILQSCL